MDIVITKVSQDKHRIRVVRQDGSTEWAMLTSRSFLRHDFAHFAVEAEVPIRLGYWGLVAAGATLRGDCFIGRDIELAEKLAGPVQTLMRLEESPASYLGLLQRTVPTLATPELAQRIFDHARRLVGHWRATPYGGSMAIAWQLQ